MKRIYILFSILTAWQWAIGQEKVTLSWAITQALENNYGIRLAKLSALASVTQNNWGTTGIYPSVALNGNYNAILEQADNDTKTNTYYGGVDVNWIFFNGLGAVIEKGKLEKMEELSNGQVAALVEETVKNVSVAYYSLLLATEQANVIAKQANLSEDLYNYQEERKKIGTAISFDVLQAKTAWLENKSALIRQEIAINDAKRTLLLLIGASGNDIPELADSLAPVFYNYPLDSLLQNMASSNKNIANQYLQLAIKEDDIAYAKSRYLPTLQASSGSGLYGTSVDNRVTAKTDANGMRYKIGISLSVPIFTGGQRSRAVQLAKIAKEVQAVTINQMTQTLNNNLRSAHESYLLNNTLVELAQENSAAAELNYSLAQEKFRAGSINSFNLRDVQNNYLNAEINILQAKFQLLASELDLLLLSGSIIKELD